MNSAKADVGKLVAPGLRQLREEMLHKICSAKEIPIYGAERLQQQKEGNFRCA